MEVASQSIQFFFLPVRKQERFNTLESDAVFLKDRKITLKEMGFS